ncbi:MAG: DUF3412 domain-containing protein [Candidatus Latescibacteria bacterium]|nr:DUF3412 domain-containing protein [Candidatus Latescibacterota bacterium]
MNESDSIVLQKHPDDIEVRPLGSLELLSQVEVAQLSGAGEGELHGLFRRCSLAVLNTGSLVDDAASVLEQFADYVIRIRQDVRSVTLQISNAPASAFVDGEMIRGIKEHLFSVLRDVVYIKTEVEDNSKFDLDVPSSITDAVFHILRNARVLQPGRLPDLVVCWGGHAIDREEYDYSKDVGYQLGLRGLNICTGCGPGAMKGPMKGATIGHAKQRLTDGRYIGITEPDIIAAESPNPIVNRLVIMPDIEKRLEAFVRMGHGIVVFPGGVGTTEEILFLLGVLMHPQNADQHIPLVFTGPGKSADYFRQIDELIGAVLGPEAQRFYDIIVDDPVAVAHAMVKGVKRVRQARRQSHDAFSFNWLVHIPEDFQRPFAPTHENMAQLQLRRSLQPWQLAAHLRRAFSGIVAGNVKDTGIRAIRQHGPFQLHGEAAVVEPLDRLLHAFVGQQRMKLAGANYVPCYQLAQ